MRAHIRNQLLATEMLHSQPHNPMARACGARGFRAWIASPSSTSTTVLPAFVGGVWLVCVMLLALLPRIFNTAAPPTTCWFKHATGYPCPTCGSTRAAFALASGEVSQAFILNPLVSALFIATPFAIVASLIVQRRGLIVRHIIASPWSAIALLVCVLANWAYLLVCNR